jgi:hypothetical protein
MGLQKPTITTCIDGKEHAWLIVSEETGAGQAAWEHRWCQKCGTLTQVTYDDEGNAIAVMNRDNTHYFLVPKVLNAVAK